MDVIEVVPLFYLVQFTLLPVPHTAFTMQDTGVVKSDGEIDVTAASRLARNDLKEETGSTSPLPPDPKKPSCTPDSERVRNSVLLAQQPLEHSNGKENMWIALNNGATGDDTSSDRPRGQGEADNNICLSSDTDDGPRGEGEMREESSSSPGQGEKESAMEYNTCTSHARDKLSGYLKEVSYYMLLYKPPCMYKPLFTLNPSVDNLTAIAQANLSNYGEHHSIVHGAAFSLHSGETSQMSAFNNGATGDDTSNDTPRGQGERDNELCPPSPTDDGLRGEGVMREACREQKKPAKELHVCSPTSTDDCPQGEGEMHEESTKQEKPSDDLCPPSSTDDGPQGEGEMHEEFSGSAGQGETSEATDSDTATPMDEQSAAVDVRDDTPSRKDEESTKPLPDSGSASSFPTLCSMSPSKPVTDYSPSDSEMLDTCSEVSNVDIPNEDPKNSANNEDNSSSLPDTDSDVITASALPLANQSGNVHTVPVTRDDCSDSVVPSASAKSLVKPPVDMPLEIHYHPTLRDHKTDKFQPLVSDEMESTASDSVCDASSHVRFPYPTSLSCRFNLCTFFCLQTFLVLCTSGRGSTHDILHRCTVSNITDILSQGLHEMWNGSQTYQPTNLDDDSFSYIYLFLSLIPCVGSLFLYRSVTFMLFLSWVIRAAKAIASTAYRLVVRMLPGETDNRQNLTTHLDQNPSSAGVSQSGVRDTETPVASTAPSAKPAANTAPIHTQLATRLPPKSLTVGSSTDQTLTADSGYHSPGPPPRSQIVTLSSSQANLSPEETSFPDSSGHSENSDVDSTGHGETPLPQVDDALVESATIQDSAPSEFVSIGCLLKIPHTQVSRGEVPAVEESTPPNERTYEVTLPRRRTEGARHPLQPQLINLPLILPAAQEAEPNVQIAPLPVNQDGHLLAFNAVLERQQLPLDQNVPNEELDFIPDVHNAAIPNDGDFLLHNVALVEPLMDMFQPGVLRNHPIVEQEDVLESRDHVYPSLPALPPRNERSLLVFPALPAMPSTETPVAFVPVTCVP